MGVLQVFAIWTTSLIILSSAVEFTNEQAGLLATGNYDYYNDQKTSHTEEDNAGVSPFKNPDATYSTPKILPLASPYSLQTKEFPQSPDERQYDYEDDANNQISPQNYKYSNSPPNNPNPSPNHPNPLPNYHNPPPNYPNSPPNYSNPPPNYPSPSEDSPYPPENYPNIPVNYAPNNYPSNVNQTDPNAPKVYNYNYDKVDDSDPNHITSVHSEAHQSAFKYDNSDGSEPPTGSQIGHPFGSSRPSGFTPPMQRYPGGRNNENAQYPNNIPNTNYQGIQSDTPLFSRRPGQIKNPFYSQADSDSMHNVNSASRDYSDFNSSPNFQQFLSKFRFYPRTANRW